MHNEKLAKWLAKMQSGKEGFCYWEKKDGIWKFNRGHGWIEVDKIYFCIRTSEKVLLSESWKRGDESKSKDEIVVMTKDERRLLMSVGSLLNFGFGFEEKGEEKQLLLCYRMGLAVRIIWAKSSDSQIYDAISINHIDEASADRLDTLFGFWVNSNFDSTERGDICE